MFDRGLRLMLGRITRFRIGWLVFRLGERCSVPVRLFRLVVDRRERRMLRMNLVLVRISVITIGRLRCRLVPGTLVICRLRRSMMRI